MYFSLFAIVRPTTSGVYVEEFKKKFNKLWSTIKQKSSEEKYFAKVNVIYQYGIKLISADSDFVRLSFMRSED